MSFLWHISFDNVKKLIPRVPKNRAPGEDDSTPRICFSESIEQAITAMPNGGLALRGLLKCKHKITPLLYAYICNIDENLQALIPPEMVQKRYGVRDAIYNGEWWAIAPVSVERRLLRIKDAILREGTDSNGNRGIIVKHLTYDEICRSPANAPEKFFRRHGIQIPIRDVFRAADKYFE